MRIFETAKRSDKTDESYRRSYYQSDVFNFEYFKEKDSGHPPLNGIMAALTNYIFYQKLNILSDLYAYQLFGLIAATMLILGVSILTFYAFGVFPSIVAGSFLALYPLFIAESHFNIKDPVLTSFFGLTITFFYFGIVKSKAKYIILASLFAGLSLGTKFNTFFLLFIVLPWLIFYWWRVGKFKFRKERVVLLIVSAIIPSLVLYVTWPYLWFNGIDGLINIFNYYIDEGYGLSADISRFIFFGLNFFPILWIIFTTPIPILILSVIGITWLFQKLIRDKDHTSLLIVLWLIVPIIRVTLLNTSIYGGVRHIMEFIPALALTAGAGSYFLISRFQSFKKTVIAIIFLSIMLTIIEMVNIHPNQNVYFNHLIGGLSGAKRIDFPYWGNSFGNAYLQGIEWLNRNAEKNAKLGLPIGGTVNLPRERIRADIDLSNDHFSAFARKGEYQIEMSHDSLPKDSFTYAYLDTFLDSVYEVKVDGVAIIKVWKNDLKHTKLGFEKEKNYPVNSVLIENGQLKIQLGSEIYLTRLYVNYDQEDCQNKKNGNVATSIDGVSWQNEPDPISYPQMLGSHINTQGDFFFLFAAKPAKLIVLNLADKDSCLLKNPQVKVMGLEKLPD